VIVVAGANIFNVDRFDTWLIRCADGLSNGQKYLFSVLLSGVALAVGWAVSLLDPELSLVVSIPAAATAVMVFGLRQGLLVLILGGLGVQFFIFPPLYSFTVPPYEAGIFLTYYLCGGLVCAITGRLHQARLRLQATLGRFRQATEERDAAVLQRQRTSEELQRTMDIAPVALVIAQDPACTVIIGNRASEDLLEMPGAFNNSAQGPLAATLPFRPVDDDMADLPPDRLPVQRAARGERIHDEELNLLFSDGRIKRVSVSATPIHYGGSAIVGAVAALTDITARHRVEAELKAAKQQAELANEAKSRFLAAASHDLRQPLQALNLYLDVLAARVGEGALLDHMRRCSNSLNALLSDLLDLSRLDAGVVTPQCSDFAVDDLLRAVFAAHAGPAAQKGLALRAVPTSARTFTDHALIERVIGNLVANAVRYTEAGGIVFGVRRRDGAPWIEVWDSGIGIPGDKIGEIFEEFRQLGNPERNREKGTGLGLAIVRKTMDLLGLRVEVRSRPGHGSVFAVELAPCRDLPAAATPATFAAPGRLRILVIEDDANVRDALAVALAEDGHAVEVRMSLADLRTDMGAAPDLVVADFRLADGNTGLDAIAAVRTVFGKVPAVVLTAETLPRTVADIAAAGIHVLHKPINVEALRRCLAAVTAS
jgi:signal transduction histidine kinase/CheY-like chemotaxis protein